MRLPNPIVSTIDVRYQTIGLLLVLTGLMVAYLYFLSSSVVHVVISQEYAHAQTEVASAITELEAEYIQIQHTVRKEIALQQGFVAVDEKTFVTPFDTTLVAGHGDR